MKSTKSDKKSIGSSPILNKMIRKVVMFYSISIASIVATCLLFGFHGLDSIGTGLVVGSLSLVLFGALTFAGNTIPDQLGKLSLPKYNAPTETPHRDSGVSDSSRRDVANRFFLIAFICAAFLFLTGAVLKIAW